MLFRFLIFLLLNFGALALGGLFTGKGVSSDWYQGLAKAPWTPPGWVFGAAWTFIMVCFALFMAVAWPKRVGSALVALYIVQWVLNVAWNPAFFYFRQTALALVLISLLTIVVGVLFWQYVRLPNKAVLAVLPYLVWLIIATSLNAYVVVNN